MTQASPVNSLAGNRLVFEASIDVPAPIGEVYRRWTNFTRFPDFMENVEQVQPLGGNRYHWIARIFGIKQEWDAEVTEQQTDSRVSWRSSNGSYNAGTVSFSPLGPDRTEVRLRLEYTPPGGQAVRAIDKLTQTTRREVSEDLKNFKKLYAGGPSATQDIVEIGDITDSGTSAGSLIMRMAVPVAAGVAGGIIGYTLERNARASHRLPMQRPVEPIAATAGWVFTGASAASILSSAILRMRGDKHNALFVGQWAPTLLTAGILSRAVGHRSIRTPLNTAGTSWGFAAATLGTIATSAALHARGRRHDGLFVGQWAPTFLATALLARLFDR